MDLTLGRWRARHLLLAWSAYWAGLAAVTLTPALRALDRLSGPGEHGTAGATFSDGVLTLTVASPEAPGWTGAATVGELAFWVAVPPLLLWLLWLLRRPRRAPVAAEPLSHPGTAPGVAAPTAARALPDAGFPPAMGSPRSAQPVPEPRDRPA
jgi:hypothetical protein